MTTSPELELGTDDVAKWYAARQGHSLINYGVSAGHIPMRIHVMTGQDVPSLSAAHTPAAEAANHREVTAEELGKFHLRYASLLEPETGIAALEEVIAAAAATGAQLHVAHIACHGSVDFR